MCSRRPASHTLSNDLLTCPSAPKKVSCSPHCLLSSPPPPSHASPTSRMCPRVSFPATAAGDSGPSSSVSSVFVPCVCWRCSQTLLGLAFLTSVTTLAFILTDQISTAAVQLPRALEPLALLLALCLTRVNHLRTRSSSYSSGPATPAFFISTYATCHSETGCHPPGVTFSLPTTTRIQSPKPPTLMLTANVFSIWSLHG